MKCSLITRRKKNQSGDRALRLYFMLHPNLGHNTDLRGQYGVHINLVVTLNIQWTLFKAKSDFQMTTNKHSFSLKLGVQEYMTTTEHGFSLKSGFTKILCTSNIPLSISKSYNSSTVLPVWDILEEIFSVMLWLLRLYIPI